MSEEVPLRIVIDAPNARDAGARARTLKEHLDASVPAFAARVQRESNDSQDAGTILLGILSTHAILEMARALHAFVLKNRNTSIKISSSGIDIVGPEAISALSTISQIEGVLEKAVSSK